MISSVFPWTTASGLMMAKVQVFSGGTAMSRGRCCQLLGSQGALSRLSGGLLQGPHSLCTRSQGSPAWPPAVSPQTWTLVGAQVWLQTSASTARDPTPGGRPWGTREGWGGDQRLPRIGNPGAAERAGLQRGVGPRSRSSSGLATPAPSAALS